MSSRRSIYRPQPRRSSSRWPVTARSFTQERRAVRVTRAALQPRAVSRAASHLEIVALDVVDVVVSKLKRFNANDQADIDAMVARDLVSHDRLLDRFRSAVDEFAVDKTAIELPSWI